MMNRAYAILEVKTIDEGQRTIRGIATTPSVDRIGDVIDPLGVKFTNPMPFLWQHNHDQPIGTVSFDTPTKDGVNFEATLPLIDQEGTLRDRIDEAWQSIKAGLVRAVSIGFRPLEYAFIENNGIRYDEIEVYELSAVTIPANSEALITSVKSIDAALRKAAGVADPEIPSAPDTLANSGKKAVVVRLGTAARERAPFVINKIHPERAPQ